MQSVVKRAVDFIDWEMKEKERARVKARVKTVCNLLMSCCVHILRTVTHCLDSFVWSHFAMLIWHRWNGLCELFSDAITCRWNRQKRKQHKPMGANVETAVLNSEWKPILPCLSLRIFMRQWSSMRWQLLSDSFQYGVYLKFMNEPIFHLSLFFMSIQLNVMKLLTTAQLFSKQRQFFTKPFFFPTNKHEKTTLLFIFINKLHLLI